MENEYLKSIFDGGLAAYSREKRDKIGKREDSASPDREIAGSIRDLLAGLVDETKRTNRLKALELRIRLILEGQSLAPSVMTSLLDEIGEEMR